MLFHPAKVPLKVISTLFNSHSACCVAIDTDKLKILSIGRSVCKEYEKILTLNIKSFRVDLILKILSYF